MALQSFSKSKASTLAKIAVLPRYRHPKDLLNEPTLSYQVQKQQIQGLLPEESGQYLSQHHFKLCQSAAKFRNQYRQSSDLDKRKQLATQIQSVWTNYLNIWQQKPQAKLSQEQKQRVYEAMLTAKERNQQRLALNRFIKFGYEYSQAFKVDIPLNPVIIMKLVHPHFGYLNNLPNLPQYKYTHEELFTLIEQFNAASLIRDKGYTLHSSQVLSLIFWKIKTMNNKQGVSAKQFVDLLHVFKFNKVTTQNFKNEFKYSIKEGDLLEKEGNTISFDVFRQIFLDRDL